MMVCEWGQPTMLLQLLVAMILPVVFVQQRGRLVSALQTYCNSAANHCGQVDPLMAQRMATWVLWGVINWQREDGTVP